MKLHAVAKSFMPYEHCNLQTAYIYIYIYIYIYVYIYIYMIFIINVCSYTDDYLYPE